MISSGSTGIARPAGSGARYSQAVDGYLRKTALSSGLNFGASPADPDPPIQHTDRMNNVLVPFGGLRTRCSGLGSPGDPSPPIPNS